MKKNKPSEKWIEKNLGVHLSDRQLNNLYDLLASARKEAKREEGERLRIHLDAIVKAHLWGDYSLSTQEVYERCLEFLEELKEEKQA